MIVFCCGRSIKIKTETYTQTLTVSAEKYGSWRYDYIIKIYNPKNFVEGSEIENKFKSIVDLIKYLKDKHYGYVQSFSDKNSVKLRHKNVELINNTEINELIEPELLKKDTKLSKKIINKIDENFILTKEVDWTIFNYGLVVSKDLQDKLWSAIGFKMDPGESQKIKLQFNSKLFDAILINWISKEKRFNQSGVVQIRYAETSEIALEMRKVFKEIYQYLITQKESYKVDKLPTFRKPKITITYLENDIFAIDCPSQSVETINVTDKDLSENRVNFSDNKSTFLFSIPYRMIFLNKEITVKNWADVLTKMVEVLIIEYPDVFFELCSNVLAQKKLNILLTFQETYLERNPKQLAIRHLPNGIWIQFRFAPYSILRICESLCGLCGIDISSVAIFYKTITKPSIKTVLKKDIRKDNKNEETTRVYYRVDFADQRDIYTLTQPVQLKIDEKFIRVRSWADTLIKLCEVLITLHPEIVASFDKNSINQRPKWIYFTYSPNFLIEGHKLSNGIWVETYLKPMDSVKICKLLCNECGININDVEILYRKNNKPTEFQKNIYEKNANIEIYDEKVKEPKAIEYSVLDKAIEATIKNSKSPLSLDTIMVTNKNAAKGKVRRILENSKWAVYSKGKYIHRDNIAEFDKVAEIILANLKMLFNNHSGYVSAKQLYDAVKTKLDDFFFYCGFESRDEIYNLTKHLFEKELYNNFKFIFYNEFHIWEKEPEYPKSYTGLFVKWARENNGIISRDECMKGLESIGAGSIAANYSNAYLAGRHLFWQYEPYKFVLVEAVRIDENWRDILIARLRQLLQDISFIALRDIDEYWYSSLPSLPFGVVWSPLLIQEALADIDVGFKTISAGEGQDASAVHAVVLPKNSHFNTFGDIVWKVVDEELGTPTNKIEAEFLRKILVKNNILKGNERYLTMHKAIPNDLRFMWLDNNKSVIISKK